MSWERTPIAIEDSIAYRIYRTARLLRRHLGGMAREVGMDLTTEQWFVLNRLRRAGEGAQVELGDAIFDDRPSLTRMLAKMEQAGWVSRRRDPADGRRTLVRLTEQGEAAHDRFAAAVGDARALLLGDFSAAELATVTHFLDRLDATLIAESE